MIRKCREGKRSDLLSRRFTHHSSQRENTKNDQSWRMRSGYILAETLDNLRVCRRLQSKDQDLGQHYLGQRYRSHFDTQILPDLPNKYRRVLLDHVHLRYNRQQVVHRYRPQCRLDLQGNRYFQSNFGSSSMHHSFQQVVQAE